MPLSIFGFPALRLGHKLCMRPHLSWRECQPFEAVPKGCLRSIFVGRVPNGAERREKPDNAPSLLSFRSAVGGPSVAGKQESIRGKVLSWAPAFAGETRMVQSGRSSSELASRTEKPDNAPSLLSFLSAVGGAATSGIGHLFQPGDALLDRRMRGEKIGQAAAGERADDK